MMKLVSARLMVLILFVVCPAAAHDYWIEASNFQLEPGARVLFYLRVGESFNGRPAAFSTDWVKRFRVDNATQHDPVKLLRDDPAGTIRVEQQGLQVVSFEDTATYLELPAEQFNRYLQAEGLTAILAARQAAGASDQPGRESYSRCAKSLLWVGSPESAAVGAPPNKPVGMSLELLPEQNPYRMTAPAPMSVQLLYQGQPVGGALVMALNKSAPNEVQRVPSGPDGRAMFNLQRHGLWLVKAVHMIPADTQVQEDWRSYWASLTFELPAGP
jgi:uncharacterized GH25 family protein